MQAVDLLQPSDHVADICATLLYPVTDRPYRELYELACGWPAARRQEMLAVVLGSRSRKDELPRHFRSAPYVFDFVMDIGAYRDLHRHRRCQQFRQQYTAALGYETPEVVAKCGAEETFSNAIREIGRGRGKTASARGAVFAPICFEIALSLQDGFRRTRVHRSPA